jgi:hypothetical protein
MTVAIVAIPAKPQGVSPKVISFSVPAKLVKKLKPPTTNKSASKMRGACAEIPHFFEQVHIKVCVNELENNISHCF